MTLDELIARVRARFDGPTAAVGNAVAITVQELGLQIAADGTIVQLGVRPSERYIAAEGGLGRSEWQPPGGLERPAFIKRPSRRRK